jgi:hypothetical protein
MAQALGIALKLTLQGANQFVHAETYFCILVRRSPGLHPQPSPDKYRLALHSSTVVQCWLHDAGIVPAHCAMETCRVEHAVSCSKNARAGQALLAGTNPPLLCMRAARRLWACAWSRRSTT